MNTKFNRKRVAYSYEYTLGHPFATLEDVVLGKATYVGEISPLEKVKVVRTTKWKKWWDQSTKSWIMTLR
jgi:hypothetical protein